jgi:uncharacterized protein YbjT (DUF2867 family)
MIIVAGGTGFIGRAIAAELSRRGREVAVLSHRSGNPTIYLGGRDVPIRKADVTEPRSLAEALQGAEAVVGAAQFKDFPNENPGKGLTFDAVDRQGTENLLDAASALGIKQYVYISGAGAGLDAPQPWFRAKGAAERAVRTSGLRYAIFRPTWVYGPGDQALNKYVAFVRSPLPVVPVIGNGSQRLQPVFVDDLARAVADSLEGSGPADTLCEIGGPDVRTMDEVIRAVEEVTGKHKPLVHQPVGLMKLLFSPKALIPALPIPLSPKALEFATMDAVADNSALLAAFPSLRLTPLEAGLQSYLGRGAPAAAAV